MPKPHTMHTPHRMTALAVSCRLRSARLAAPRMATPYLTHALPVCLMLGTLVALVLLPYVLPN